MKHIDELSDLMRNQFNDKITRIMSADPTLSRKQYADIFKWKYRQWALEQPILKADTVYKQFNRLCNTALSERFPKKPRKRKDLPGQLKMFEECVPQGH